MDSDYTAYQYATEWLFSQLPMFSRIGGAAYKAGLDRVMDLDHIFGHPHSRYATIHIAGTNGKGSTSHLIASALMAKGLKVGLYTSPHLVDFRERIKVNGEMIPREAVVRFTERIKSMHFDDHPSFFEITMMMAFCWFAEAKVDVAVIETGMGGRLDSTNIITPLISVITNISPDHTQFLGPTLRHIAAEKAGIIKTGVPCVIGERQTDLEEVFISKCSEHNAPITFASDNTDNLKLTSTPSGWQITFPSGLAAIMPLGGDYQRHNILTAWRAITSLPEQFRPTEYEIAHGFTNVIAATGLAGRWMILNQNPKVIADTGHNIAGLQSNMAQLKALQDSIPGSRLLMVIGFVSDKDVDNILHLFPANAYYYFTRANIPRAMDVDTLAAKASAAGLKGINYPDVVGAYKAALADASPIDIIYVGGSTFIVADLLAAQ